MSLGVAEKLYRVSETRDYEYPPLWLDILFAFVLSIVHIYYAFKFTKFSFCFLNAKCEEKQSGTNWSSSKIYLRTILSYGMLKDDNDIKLHLHNISLWTQVTIVRNIIRILIFVLCWVVLILYITLALNILFEYLIACIVNYQKGSFLALIVLPLFLFTNIIIIKYIFFGIMASWSINADIIADQIAEEIQSQKAKRFAFKGSMHLSSNPYADDDLFSIPDFKSIVHLLSVSTGRTDSKMDTDDIKDDIKHNDEKQNEQTEEKLETEDTIRIQKTFMTAFHSSTDSKEPTKQLSFRQKLWAPYFLAVRWRLTVILCAIICTMIALPAMRFEGDDVLITDTFWFQIFLRYMMIAVGLWLFLYVLMSMFIALYGRISTISIYSDIFDENGNQQTKSKRRIKNALRFFCLLDAFSLSDTHRAWKQCKVLSISFIFFTGFILSIIGWAIQYGLIWFVGVAFIAYYIINAILTSKPRGIHYLWKGNMNALELELEHATEITKIERKYVKRLSEVVAESHAANMTHLTPRQLNRLLSRHMSTRKNKLFEMAELKVDSTPTQDNNKEVTFNDDVDIDRRGTIETEEDVIKLFCRLHCKIIDDRKALYAERNILTSTELMRDSLCCCCPGIIRALNWLLIKHYILSLFKEYRGYWLLILPYNYEIRPLSVCPNGNGAVLEKIFKFNYSEKSISETISIAITSLWHTMRGFICFILTFGFLLLMLWISLNFTKSASNEFSELIINDENNIKNTSDALYSPYPVCDINWNGNLSVLDLTSISHLSHEIDKREDIISMQDMICLYFDGEFSNNSSANNCQWKIIYISRDEPVFMHLRHTLNATDVIAIRGTESNVDSLQDFSLFNQVTLLQTASWIVPVTSILPRSFIIQLVYYMSFFEGHIDTQMRQRYDEPVFNYAYNFLKHDIPYQIESFYIVGHSLGGSVSQAVIGQLHHLYHAGFIINENNKDLISNKFDLRSFSYGSPGMVFNSRKFSLDLNDLYDTATLLKISHDAISNIDVPGGLVQNVECSESQFYQCHKRKNIICELGNECGFEISNNPNLIQTMCINKHITGGYIGYMAQLYNFTNVYYEKSQTTTTTDIPSGNKSMAKFESNYWYTSIFWIILYNIICIFVIELCRKYEIAQILMCCLVFPFAPIYMIHNTLSTFGWAKLFSVIITLIILIRIRYHQPKNKCLYWFTYGLYIFNIFEAFLVELFIIGNKYSYINMVAALILIICTNVPLKRNHTIFVNTKSYKTINYKMSIYYILCYTIWNYTFALNYKCYEKLLISTLHLGVPLYFILIFNKLPKFCKNNDNKPILSSEWLFIRAASLVFFLYIESMPFDESIPFWDITECNGKSVDTAVKWIVNVISVGMNIVLLCYQIYSISAKSNNNDDDQEIEEEQQQNNGKTASFIQFVIASLCCK